MRRKFVFGLGLAGVLSGSAFGQFAVDRAPTPPVAPVSPANPGAATPGSPVPMNPVVNTPGSPAAAPALPAGVRPVGSGSPVGGGAAYVPPVGGIGSLPATVAPKGPAEPPPPLPPDSEIRSALGPNHPWAVKPEHGAAFICVKSYSRPSKPDPNDPGPSARELAEALAADIRELYRVQTFLFEYVSEERKAEAAAVAAAKERARLFASQLDKYKQEAQLKGMTFLDDERLKIHYKTVNYRDQIAVLVGGFKSEEDARKALDKVRTWPDPKNKLLMDGAAVVRTGKDGKPESAHGHINPYLAATVVSNPTIARQGQPAAAQVVLDPFVVELNEGRPYSLLKATKGWTLAVKSFSAPVEIVGQNGTTGAMRKIGTSKGADVLKAGAEQAEAMAVALRGMKGRGGEPLGLESFVLHTRGASLVTVGQFDGPNDPALIQTKQLLSSLKLNVTEDKTGLRPVMNAPSLFGNLMPMPVPKQ